jgi:transcriptional regulator with XRE-family HTH domain
MEDDPDGVDADLGSRIKALRSERGLTLDALGERSGVSRAMISRIERGESSATAQLLARLAAGLDVTLSTLFSRSEPPSSPLSRRPEQSVWRDPGTGYVRRRVSPASSDGVLELVEVTLPPGARVGFDRLPMTGVEQLVLVLSGSLEMGIGDDLYSLATGDCLHMRFDKPHSFVNASGEPVRYLVTIALKRGAAS